MEFIEAAVNRILQLDPEFLAELEVLSGKVLRVRVEGAGLDFCLRPEATGVAVFPASRLACEDGVPAADVTLSGPPFSLMALLTRVRDDEVLLSGDVTITGDVAVVQKLRSIAGGLNVDWEEQLSRAMGDVPAHQFARLLRTIGNWGLQAGDTLLRDVAEFLEQETTILPAHDELRAWHADVDVLRDDVERLEARIARLDRGTSP